MQLPDEIRKDMPKVTNEGQVLDFMQVGLDIAGMIPVYGLFFDLANSVISFGRGDMIGAGSSLISAIPVAGDGYKVGKVGTKIPKLVMTGKPGVRALKGVKNGGTKVINTAKASIDKAAEFSKIKMEMLLNDMSGTPKLGKAGKNPKVPKKKVGKSPKVVDSKWGDPGGGGKKKGGGGEKKVVVEGEGKTPNVDLNVEINNVEIINSKGVPLGELDGLDLKNGIIYEDKAVKGLDIINPKTGKPQQSPEKWANKQIYEKTKTRIGNIHDAVDTKLPGGISLPDNVDVPSLDKIKSLKKFVFRLEGDSPDLRKAMSDVIEKLQKEFPSYRFDVEYMK